MPSAPSKLHSNFGIKTGYTGKAGRCLVASAVKNDIQLLSVVLGTRDHFKNSKVLLDYGFSNYKLVKAIEKSKCSNVVNVENGKEDKVFIQAKDDIFIPKAENEEMRLEMVIPNKIKAPILKNQQIGVAYVYINDKAVYSTPMIAKKDIKEKTLSDVIYDIFRIWLDINKHLSSLSNLSNKSALKLNPRITLDRG
ncbi:MAG TPA: D-alanyl-D-alanine carboxypeptidase [Thermoanaerobacterales bacterium]|nr:D-alanyl-D-alanine carboxypeptidase [Thermoanaerobacterales bacterium]